jgi:hypothetical protein
MNSYTSHIERDLCAFCGREEHAIDCPWPAMQAGTFVPARVKSDHWDRPSGVRLRLVAAKP